MSSAYAHIAGNYFRPLESKIALGVFALWTLLYVYILAQNNNQHPELITFMLLPSAILAAGIVMLTRTQIATWQASLVPGYRRPHLIVGAIVLAVALVLLPVLFNLPLGLSTWSVIALCA